MKHPTKTCRVCKINKELKEFYPNKQCKQNVTGTCRSCSRVRINKWYSDNRKRRQEVANLNNQKRKHEAIVKFGDKCFDCSQSYPDYVYDFHHIDSRTKDLNPSKVLSMSKNKRDLELAKCILLCSNCHRERHFGKSDLTDRKEARA